MKTVSLELAKQLKEAGYPQESYFHWGVSPLAGANLWDSKQLSFTSRVEDFSAPTADEILELLPNYIAVVSAGGGRNSERVDYVVWENMNSRFLNNTYGFKPYRDGMNEERDKNLADALAKMWLYLKK